MATQKGIIRGFFGSLIDIRRWSSYDEVESNARMLTRVIKDLYVRGNKNRAVKGDVVSANSSTNISSYRETFADAARRLQFTEEDIKKRTRYFFFYAVIYFLMAVVLLVYSIYLIFSDNRVLGVIASFVLTFLMLIYSFHEHFWYMQMKKRKIGCTVKDWVHFVLGRAE